ncbi:hypothetical protein ACH3VR_04155 [Microbacterium sp. B2969]|uniref:Uncharacterized protein n=1 Tax=Microbacterium alkaliflavum TaxID=3248839 RepID=A0ABW7Q590_9MICO
MQPFVELQVGGGLRGVTKLKWREWPTRSWLSWVIAALFVGTAGLVCYLLAPSADELPEWARIVRLVGLGVLVLLIAVRLLLEATVSKTLPGEAPPGDRKFADPWWSTIHTTTGVVLGLWLIPFLVVALLTMLWEVLEISVPGFGDEEINGNRMFDILLAWTGWLVAGLIIALGTDLALRLI